MQGLPEKRCKKKITFLCFKIVTGISATDNLLTTVYGFLFFSGMELSLDFTKENFHISAHNFAEAVLKVCFKVLRGMEYNGIQWNTIGEARKDTKDKRFSNLHSLLS